jgi:hypothetical protein
MQKLALQNPETGGVIFAVALALGIVMAPVWLVQKIIWQKAALPFLYRLADVNDESIKDEDARLLTEFVNEAAPPEKKGEPPQKVSPRQIVIGGPIGSGRTEMAAAIGTEFAFKGRKVRYVTLTQLLEFADSMPVGTDPDMHDPTSSPNRNDAGPDNIQYWSWLDAQVLIIDDIGPLISAQARDVNVDVNADKIAHFSRILDVELLKIENVLRTCHTIWVVGIDSASDADRTASRWPKLPTLSEITETIVQRYGGLQRGLAIRLADRPQRSPKGPAHLKVGSISLID